jgi:hypothetical protein
MGASVSELVETPERWNQLAYRLSGGGLVALP